MGEFIKIPEDRVGALIGKGGKTKAMIGDRCKVKLDVTKDGGVTIESPDEDGLAEWQASSIVKAIGRGFNPKIAITLLKEGLVLDIIDLYSILGRKDAALLRMKSRIIGEGGKARRVIEGLTSTRISVYGKTVSIIGLEEDVETTRKGINMILSGAQHQSVYKFLEGNSRERRQGL